MDKVEDFISTSSDDFSKSSHPLLMKRPSHDLAFLNRTLRKFRIRNLTLLYTILYFGIFQGIIIYASEFSIQAILFLSPLIILYFSYLVYGFVIIVDKSRYHTLSFFTEICGGIYVFYCFGPNSQCHFIFLNLSLHRNIFDDYDHRRNVFSRAIFAIIVLICINSKFLLQQESLDLIISFISENIHEMEKMDVNLVIESLFSPLFVHKHPTDPTDVSLIEAGFLVFFVLDAVICLIFTLSLGNEHFSNLVVMKKLHVDAKRIRETYTGKLILDIRNFLTPLLSLYERLEILNFQLYKYEKLIYGKNGRKLELGYYQINLDFAIEHLISSLEYLEGIHDRKMNHNHRLDSVSYTQDPAFINVFETIKSFSSCCNSEVFDNYSGGNHELVFYGDQKSSRYNFESILFYLFHSIPMNSLNSGLHVQNNNNNIQLNICVNFSTDRMILSIYVNVLSSKNLSSSKVMENMVDFGKSIISNSLCGELVIMKTSEFIMIFPIKNYRKANSKKSSKRMISFSNIGSCLEEGILSSGEKKEQGKNFGGKDSIFKCVVDGVSGGEYSYFQNKFADLCSVRDKKIRNKINWNLENNSNINDYNCISEKLLHSVKFQKQLYFSNLQKLLSENKITYNLKEEKMGIINNKKNEKNKTSDKLKILFVEGSRLVQNAALDFLKDMLMIENIDIANTSDEAIQLLLISNQGRCWNEKKSFFKNNNDLKKSCSNDSLFSDFSENSSYTKISNSNKSNLVEKVNTEFLPYNLIFVGSDIAGSFSGLDFCKVIKDQELVNPEICDLHLLTSSRIQSTFQKSHYFDNFEKNGKKSFSEEFLVNIRIKYNWMIKSVICKPFYLEDLLLPVLTIKHKLGFLSDEIRECASSVLKNKDYCSITSELSNKEDSTNGGDRKYQSSSINKKNEKVNFRTFVSKNSEFTTSSRKKILDESIAKINSERAKITEICEEESDDDDIGIIFEEEPKEENNDPSKEEKFDLLINSKIKKFIYGYFIRYVVIFLLISFFVLLFFPVFSLSAIIIVETLVIIRFITCHVILPILTCFLYLRKVRNFKSSLKIKYITNLEAKIENYKDHDEDFFQSVDGIEYEMNDFILVSDFCVSFVSFFYAQTILGPSNYIRYAFVTSPIGLTIFRGRQAILISILICSSAFMFFFLHFYWYFSKISGICVLQDFQDFLGIKWIETNSKNMFYINSVIECLVVFVFCQFPFGYSEHCGNQIVGLTNVVKSMEMEHKDCEGLMFKISQNIVSRIKYLKQVLELGEKQLEQRVKNLKEVQNSNSNKNSRDLKSEFGRGPETTRKYLFVFEKFLTFRSYLEESTQCLRSIEIVAKQLMCCSCSLSENHTASSVAAKYKPKSSKVNYFPRGVISISKKKLSRLNGHNNNFFDESAMLRNLAIDLRKTLYEVMEIESNALIEQGVKLSAQLQNVPKYMIISEDIWILVFSNLVLKALKNVSYGIVRINSKFEILSTDTAEFYWKHKAENKKDKISIILGRYCKFSIIVSFPKYLECLSSWKRMLASKLNINDDSEKNDNSGEVIRRTKSEYLAELPEKNYMDFSDSCVISTVSEAIQCLLVKKIGAKLKINFSKKDGKTLYVLETGVFIPNLKLIGLQSNSEITMNQILEKSSERKFVK